MDESIIELTLLDAKDRMQKVIAHTHSEFGAFRTGRASSSIVERLPVEYYGTEVPLLQIAGFSVPEARVLVITPYDKGALGAIEKAIQASDVGINPSNDGAVIRLNFPVLTEQRRKDLVKQVKHRAEEGRVGIRNLRRTIRQELEAAQKRNEINQDQLDRAEKDLEKITADSIADIDKMLESKEKELLEI
ncbi:MULTISPECIES: ribosome recycling factor [Acidithrix]|uniref:Ribosome-recycling factor n=2 Tax=root TaxID=1 RepID=A0A0D8HMK0_9ACTN|nr:MULTISPECIES: ribosome recycling factor [Acidithrix]KJF18972.1 ribosome-recycling factor [Acidithrix ferrooxidans]CAG4900435.1 unnamed protein product [Acidithrix sp. C25]